MSADFGCFCGNQFCQLQLVKWMNEYFICQDRYNTVKTVKSRSVSTGQKGSKSTYKCPKNEETHCTKTYKKRHTHIHIRLTTLCLGLPGWAGTRKVKPIWILLKQETVSGSGISWAICKSAPRSREITMPAPHHSVFTGRMPFLPPSQQRQSTEGNCLW